MQHRPWVIIPLYLVIRFICAVSADLTIRPHLIHSDAFPWIGVTVHVIHRVHIAAGGWIVNVKIRTAIRCTPSERTFDRTKNSDFNSFMFRSKQHNKKKWRWCESYLLASIAVGGFNKCWFLIVKLCNGWFWSIGKLIGKCGQFSGPPNLKLIGADGLFTKACSCATSPGPTVWRLALPVVTLALVLFACCWSTVDDSGTSNVRDVVVASTSISTNFSKSLLVGSLMFGNDMRLLVLVSGLRRSASDLTNSERSTMPVVILVFLDLKQTQSEMVHIPRSRQHFFDNCVLTLSSQYRHDVAVAVVLFSLHSTCPPTNCRWRRCDCSYFDVSNRQFRRTSDSVTRACVW